MEFNVIGLGGIQFDFRKEPVENPYEGRTVIFDECQDECLLGLDDVTDDPGSQNDIEFTGVSIYMPGYGVIGIDASSSGTYAALPRGGFSYRPKGADWTFATSFFVNIALGFELKEENEGKYGGINYVSLGSFNMFAPAIAWKLNEQWSVGMSLGAQNMGLAAALNLRLPLPIFGALNQGSEYTCDNISDILLPFCDIDDPLSPIETLAKIELELEDIYTPSYTFGVLWEPKNWFTWGFLYRGSVPHRLKGKADVTYSDAIAELFQSSLPQILLGAADRLPDGVNSESIRVNIPFTMPKHLSTGISLMLTPRLKFNADYKWTEYSKWNTWQINFEHKSQISGGLGLINGGDSDSVILPMGMVDKGNRAFGLEYRWNDHLTLRAGYEHRPSVIPKDKQSILIPIADITLRNVGFRYEWDRETYAEVALGVIKSLQELPWDPDNPIVLYPGHSVEVELEIPLVMLAWQKEI